MATQQAAADQAATSEKAGVTPKARIAAEADPAAPAAQPKTEEGDFSEIPVVKANYDRDAGAPGQRKAVLMVCQVSSLTH